MRVLPCPMHRVPYIACNSAHAVQQGLFACVYSAFDACQNPNRVLYACNDRQPQCIACIPTVLQTTHSNALSICVRCAVCETACCAAIALTQLLCCNHLMRGYSCVSIQQCISFQQSNQPCRTKLTTARLNMHRLNSILDLPRQTLQDCN